MGCLKVLLEHNANPNQRTNDGATPLLTAALKNNVLAVRLLVVHGANMAATTAFNHTPADVAAQLGHQPLAEWLASVATWSPLRVAAALRMHTCITFLLQHGRLDPDDRIKFPAKEIMAAIAASTAAPAKLPWENGLPICKATVTLVHDASFGWKYSAHQLYHTNVKNSVFAVLLVVGRFERRGRAIDNTADAAAADAQDKKPLPLLPPEIWLFIMHFFQRSWWSVAA